MVSDFKYCFLCTHGAHCHYPTPLPSTPKHWFNRKILLQPHDVKCEINFHFMRGTTGIPEKKLTYTVRKIIDADRATRATDARTDLKRSEGRGQ